MKTELFTLCDSAQDYLGKAVIVGTFNEVNAPSYPTVLMNATLVVRIAFEPQEAVNTPMQLIAYNISDPELKIADLTAQLTIVPSSNGQRTFSNLMLKLDGMSIPKQGTYRFEIRIGDWSDNIELYVKMA